MNHSRTLALAGLIAIIAIGCADGDPPPAAGPPAAAATSSSTAETTLVTETDVREMAHEMLTGFDAGDYGAFSRYWDDAMKAGIGRDAFEDFQRATTAENGSYRAIARIDQQPGKTAGTTNFFVHADFSEHAMVLRLNIHDNSRLISGVELTREG
jgi:hypothetical protein